MTTLYTVTSTIQSNDTSNPPADVQWYKGEDQAVAVVALAQAAIHSNDQTGPPAFRFRLLSVNMTVTHEDDGYGSL